MYTIVYHDDELNLIDTMETNTLPKVGDVKVPYYIQEGAFDGVVDPSKGIDTRSREEILEEKLALAEERIKVTEDTFFQFLNS